MKRPSCSQKKGNRQVQPPSFPIGKSFLPGLLLLVNLFSLQGQNKAMVDSLESMLNKKITDTVRVDVLASLCWEFKGIDPIKVYQYGQQGINLANSIRYYSGLAVCYKNIGAANFYQGSYSDALENYHRSLKIAQDHGYTILAASSLNNIGTVWNEQGKYAKAIGFYEQALKIIRDSIRSCKDGAGCKGLSMKATDISDNIGLAYVKLGSVDSALYFVNTARQMATDLHYEVGMAHVYDNLAAIYLLQKKPDLALQSYHQALEIHSKNNDGWSISYLDEEIAEFYNNDREYKLATKWALDGLAVARKVKSLDDEMECLKELSDAQKGLGNYKSALENYQAYKQINDSINNLAKQKQIVYMDLMFQVEKNQKEIELLNKDKALQEAQLKRQTTLKYAFSIAFVLMVMLAFAILRNRNSISKSRDLLANQNRIIEESNKLLEQQSETIAKQKEELEIRNKELEVDEASLKEKNSELNAQNEELNVLLEELKATQAQLVESEKMATLGVLSAGLAHEINNPVNFISSGVEGLRLVMNELWEKISGGKEFAAAGKGKQEETGIVEESIPGAYREIFNDYRQIMLNIEEGLERTVHVIKSLLSFTRAEHNVRKPVDIHESLDSTLVLLRNQYINRIEITRKYANLPKVQCYPGKLNQIVMNLLSNAVQAIDREGRITITTSTGNLPSKQEEKQGKGEPGSTVNNAVVISIEDTGSGIDESIRQRIFDPFFTTKEPGKGTGLGLSITQSLVKEHGGIIRFSSQPGNGACFEVLLPLHPEQESNN